MIEGLKKLFNRLSITKEKLFRGMIQHEAREIFIDEYIDKYKEIRKEDNSSTVEFKSKPVLNILVVCREGFDTVKPLIEGIKKQREAIERIKLTVITDNLNTGKLRETVKECEKYKEDFYEVTVVENKEPLSYGECLVLGIDKTLELEKEAAEDNSECKSKTDYYCILRGEDILFNECAYEQVVETIRKSDINSSVVKSIQMKCVTDTERETNKTKYDRVLANWFSAELLQDEIFTSILKTYSGDEKDRYTSELIESYYIFNKLSTAKIDTNDAVYKIAKTDCYRDKNIDLKWEATKKLLSRLPDYYNKDTNVEDEGSIFNELGADNVVSINIYLLLADIIVKGLYDEYISKIKGNTEPSNKEQYEKLMVYANELSEINDFIYTNKDFHKRHIDKMIETLEKSKIKVEIETDLDKIMKDIKGGIWE